jgi:hypothetical protein
VNDPDPENAPFAAGLQILGDQILELLWAEGVQIQDAIDRHFNRNGLGVRRL